MTTTPTLDRLEADVRHSIIHVQKRAALALIVLLDRFFDNQRAVESHALNVAAEAKTAAESVMTFSPYVTSNVTQHTAMLAVALSARTATLCEIERMCNVLDIEWATVMNEYRAALKALDTRA